ncbi:hypothetical protein T484DRAFT_1920855 [Baffinella frigidus]|nr:hypothetical protein T484DRAFT_1920855 [Cryptophyta sp. CCMP2293]
MGERRLWWRFCAWGRSLTCEIGGSGHRYRGRSATGISRLHRRSSKPGGGCSRTGGRGGGVRSWLVSAASLGIGRQPSTSPSLPPSLPRPPR